MDRSCRHLQSHCIFRISCCVPVYRGKRCQRTYYSVIVIKTADPSICITGTPHSAVLKWLMFLVNVFIGIDRKHGPLQSPIILPNSLQPVRRSSWSASHAIFLWSSSGIPRLWISHWQNGKILSSVAAALSV